MEHTSIELSASLIFGSVLLLGAAIQWASWWAKLPAILGLLVFGLILGPATGVLNPDELLGDLLFDFVSLGVAIVLFEGALTLHFRDIKGHGPVVTNMVTWGAVACWLIMGLGIGTLTDLSWSLSMLFAALVVVTGPTVIVPLLRTVRPNQAISNILRWEGIVIDPLGALFAVFVFEIVIFGLGSHSIMILTMELVIGVVAGALGAILVAQVLKRHLIPEYLQNFFVLGVVLFVFAISNYLGEEAGLIAVTLMGIWLANTRGINIEEVLDFKENLSVIIISMLFILLAARIEFSDLTPLAEYAIPVLLVVLGTRFLVVWLCTWRSELVWQEKVFVSFVAPRGIVAAAVSSLFAIKLTEMNFAGAELLAPLTFMIILVTVLLQSVLARPVAKMLGVAEEDPRGVLIIGANTFARALAKALVEAGFRVRLASMTWADVQTSRLMGLECFFGNPVSVQADQTLDLVGIGQMVALSIRPDLNTLSCLKYRSEFGRNLVFSLRNAEEKDDKKSERLSHEFRASRLFCKDVTLEQMLQWMDEGAEIKLTRLSEEFNYEQYLEHYGDRMMPLFYVSERGHIRWVRADDTPTIKNGGSIASLVFAEEQDRPDIASLADLVSATKPKFQATQD